MRTFSILLFSLSALSFALPACTSSSSDDSAQADEANQTSESTATIRLTGDFKTEITGTLTANKPLRIEYAIERLAKCKGNTGGRPAWSVTGYYSENGGAAKTFEVSEVEGTERVSVPATITPSQGGDLALWFSAGNRWGCNEYDSAYGQNFHFDVRGDEPKSDASIVFTAGGKIEQEGALKAGGKLRVRYEQERLPECRRTQGGNPVWTISGFAQINDEKPRAFDTGRAEKGDRVPVDAILDLPKSGEIALWFQVHDIGGCNEFDSNEGANYRFRVE